LRLVRLAGEFGLDGRWMGVAGRSGVCSSSCSQTSFQSVG